MKPVYFTITGTKHYFGSDFLKPGMKVKLQKDTQNEFDSEAIAIKMDGLGKIGYVANSRYTVLGESFSAGRLYDKINKKATGTVLYVLDNGVLCRLNEFSLK
jgi:hypothetical protein